MVCTRTWHDFINIKDVIFVGDHSNDAVASKALNVSFIGIADQNDRLTKLDNVKIFSDYSDLEGFLNHMEHLWNKPSNR